MAWRRRKGTDMWHWCSNCSGWPTVGYDSLFGKPTYGELCGECLEKEQARVCL